MRKALACLGILLVLVLASVASLSSVSSGKETKGSSIKGSDQVKVPLLESELKCEINVIDEKGTLEGEVDGNLEFIDDAYENTNYYGDPFTIRCPSGTHIQVQITYVAYRNAGGFVEDGYITNRTTIGPSVARFSLLVDGKEVWNDTIRFGRRPTLLYIKHEAYPSFQVTKSKVYEITVKVECEFDESIKVKRSSLSRSEKINVIIDDEAHKEIAAVKLRAGMIHIPFLGTLEKGYAKVNIHEGSVSVKGGTILTVRGWAWLFRLGGFLDISTVCAVEVYQYETLSLDIMNEFVWGRTGFFLVPLDITFVVPVENGTYRYLIRGWTNAEDYSTDYGYVNVTVKAEDDPGSAPPSDALPVNLPQPEDQPKSQPKAEDIKAEISVASLNEGPKEPVTITVSAEGGSGSYYFEIDFGDGSTKRVGPCDSCTVTHVYEEEGYISHL